MTWCAQGTAVAPAVSVIVMTVGLESIVRSLIVQTNVPTTGPALMAYASVSGGGVEQTVLETLTQMRAHLTLTASNVPIMASVSRGRVNARLAGRELLAKTEFVSVGPRNVLEKGHVLTDSASAMVGGQARGATIRHVHPRIVWNAVATEFVSTESASVTPFTLEARVPMSNVLGSRRCVEGMGGVCVWTAYVGAAAAGRGWIALSWRVPELPNVPTTACVSMARACAKQLIAEAHVTYANAQAIQNAPTTETVLTEPASARSAGEAQPATLAPVCSRTIRWQLPWIVLDMACA